jgi:hypothetical protein
VVRVNRRHFRDGTRLAGDERILRTSEFVEKTLKEAGEGYDRKVRFQTTGVGLSRGIAPDD